MPKKKRPFDLFADLSWEDLNHWAGSKIVSQGRNYQQQGRVTDLVQADENTLVAWVNGSEQYATKVVMTSDGLPESQCTCPHELDCKHGVAVVLEYLKRFENHQVISRIDANDVRIAVLEDDDLNGGPEDKSSFLSEHFIKDAEVFISGKNETQLRELILELVQKYPEIAKELSDRRQILAGDINALVMRLRREIREVAEEPGWRNPWKEEVYTPDYSAIRSKLEILLSAGYHDAVLLLGNELIAVGTRQIERSHDEGETALEIESCMPAVMKALERTATDIVDKLVWAVDAVLKDQFDICQVFGEYLYRKHPKNAWCALADRLLAQLKTMNSEIRKNDFILNFERDKIGNWAIHALERAGRKEEIIPLCQAEAKITGSYNRLVDELMTAGRLSEAKEWIVEGISATKDKLPGVVAGLKEKLLKIRIIEKDWPAVAAMQAGLFVLNPSCKTFMDCRQVATKIKAWPKMSNCLLTYLESGKLPWLQEEWPLPHSEPEPLPENPNRNFPMIDDLIEIAIMEKKPEQVLHWYDQVPEGRVAWFGIDDDSVAAAIEAHAPHRAVEIWQIKARRLIEQGKPGALQEAVKCLRRIGAVMEREKKKEIWRKYLNDLRRVHQRNRRLVELLDGLEGRPIVQNCNL